MHVKPRCDIHANPRRTMGPSSATRAPRQRPHPDTGGRGWLMLLHVRPRCDIWAGISRSAMPPPCTTVGPSSATPRHRSQGPTRLHLLPRSDPPWRRQHEYGTSDRNSYQGPVHRRRLAYEPSTAQKMNATDQARMIVVEVAISAVGVVSAAVVLLIRRGRRGVPILVLDEP
jgi:hypothetical protein